MREQQSGSRKKRTPEEIQFFKRRSHRRMLDMQHHVLVCNGGCCQRRESEPVIRALREEVAAQDLEEQVRVTASAQCIGRCSDACALVVYPEATWYRGMTAARVPRLTREHLRHGRSIDEWTSYAMVDGRLQRSEAYVVDFEE
ncbi:(2Fe-2S) ferredoxin domain-containing protein [Paenibacillus sp. IB182496]|uniref:(2Fe-2S) ferredoxin domain-containing protein n=1 Tax=Paenibacillus sabuli TaxID=2772509 RepID=A0A927BVJ1_9BACL|nr:(2Fe-2S) ferredoxin domain-containing protein [Paenibacillus sabuli]MBD2846681.1 (2Fe-2S) ferredoxin domain-containing protein [Paenibacillus sabuli]